MFAALAIAAVLHAGPSDLPTCDPYSGMVTNCQTINEHAGAHLDCPGGSIGTVNPDGVLVCDDAAPAMDTDPAHEPSAAPSAPTTETPSVPSKVAVDPAPMTYNAADFIEWLRDFLGDFIASLTGH